MEVMYQSTRNSGKTVTASQAILKGLADDGGLFVPTSIPALDTSLEDIAKMNYQETAYQVMKQFLTDFTEEELKNCINRAYDSKFDTKEIAPLVEKDGVYYLELFHGATIAFKDMALSILPHLLTTSARKNKITNQIVILTATSGDTGKAALAGFADVEGTSIIVFYPKNGVSAIQERQMVTQKGNNTSVIGITGNFDDAQSGVKAMFNNKELAKVMDNNGYQFSSANSINIGRLVPQVVYYVYSYTRLLANGAVKAGEPVNFVVPTGNFGNILAAFYAKNMGVPVGKLICASNENKVLYDFFETGVYDKNREFILTTSPSMDILISSNLERLIYKIAGEDAEATADMMAALANTGKYTITDEMKARMKDFIGGWASEEKTAEEIKRVYEKTGYVLDTHTAVASAVYHDYKMKTQDDTKTIIASTASPYKFATSVMTAIDKKYEGMDDFALIDELSKTAGTKIPNAVEEIRSAPVLHDTVCDTKDMQKMVEKILGI
ncbi:MAG: threonine synthase [Butyribacter sp.]|nr:threonine synthase [bacterium]MDY3854456.1 threonine synthase [Butyribacter sp.]